MFAMVFSRRRLFDQPPIRWPRIPQPRNWAKDHSDECPRIGEAIDRLGQGVVKAVVDAADRRLDARPGEVLGVFD